MRGREFTAKSRSTRPTPPLALQREEAEAQKVAAPQHDPLMRRLRSTGSAPSASAHAAVLARATGSRPSQASSAILQMQRQYGNRYVQRVLGIARQGEEDSEVPSEIETAIHSAQGGGQVLDSGVRAQMEPAFGVEFGGVRVHTDAHADSLNQSLSARAFTSGRDIFFRQGEYNPGSARGQELLAHELTHVVQQGGGPIQGKLAVSQPGDALEREADEVAQSVMHQAQRQPMEEEEEKKEAIQTKADGPGVQRQTEEEEEMLQGKLIPGKSMVQLQGNTGGAKNRSGTPHPLKANLKLSNSPNGRSVLQRARDEDTDGDEWLSVSIPDGTYVLEAANIPADGAYHLEFGDYLRVYGTASQYSPRHINGLNAEPHRIDNTPAGDFRIVPGPELESAAGEGSVKVQAFRHNRILSDERVMEAYLRFDTVPLLTISGDTTYVGGTVYDMRRSNHQYFNLAEGGSAGQQQTYSRSITNGYTLSRGSSVSNTLSSSVSSKIGASIEVVSAEVGSSVSASETVTNSIQESISTSMSESTSVSYSGSAQGPGRFVIIPTAQVWRTPVTMNTFDSTGKRTGERSDVVYTVIFNNIPTILRVAEDGRTVLDLDGQPLPNQER